MKKIKNACNKTVKKKYTKFKIMEKRIKKIKDKGSSSAHMLRLNLRLSLKCSSQFPGYHSRIRTMVTATTFHPKAKVTSSIGKLKAG
jgi:hypothetical protein